MHITEGPRGILQIDDARLIFKNFSGRQTQYNREGDRNFSILIEDEELANQLIEDGWNVKVREPRDEGDLPLMHLPVKVKFNERGPKVRLQSGANRVLLDEESISLLDNAYLISCDLDIRPYDWVIQEGTKNEKRGRTAYLQSILATQEVDRFDDRFSEDEWPVDED